MILLRSKEHLVEGLESLRVNPSELVYPFHFAPCEKSRLKGK